MPQRAATPPLVQNGDATVYLVLDDFRELGSRPDDSRRSYPVNIDIPCAGGLQCRRGLGGDVCSDVARKVLTRARELDDELPASVRTLVERAWG
jgi:hypothetical protein